MPAPKAIGAVIGDVLFHLFCVYHGDLGTETTPEAATQAAALHIRTNHADAAGTVAPGADVQIHQVTHVTPAHLDKIETPPSGGGLPGAHPQT